MKRSFSREKRTDTEIGTLYSSMLHNNNTTDNTETHEPLRALPIERQTDTETEIRLVSDSLVYIYNVARLNCFIWLKRML